MAKLITKENISLLNNYLPMLLASPNTANSNPPSHGNNSGPFLFEIDNDYFQHEIYYEVRRNNSKTETWHHFFGVFGTLISIFGILGNLFVLWLFFMYGQRYYFFADTFCLTYLFEYTILV